MERLGARDSIAVNSSFIWLNIDLGRTPHHISSILHYKVEKLLNKSTWWLERAYPAAPSTRRIPGTSCFQITHHIIKYNTTQYIKGSLLPEYVEKCLYMLFCLCL
jgi:hypothetical protein